MRLPYKNEFKKPSSPSPSVRHPHCPYHRSQITRHSFSVDKLLPKTTMRVSTKVLLIIAALVGCAAAQSTETVNVPETTVTGATVTLPATSYVVVVPAPAPAGGAPAPGPAPGPAPAPGPGPAPAPGAGATGTGTGSGTATGSPAVVVSGTGYVPRFLLD